MRPVLVCSILIASLGLTSAASAKQIWAKSCLGQKAPELVVEKWLGEKPDTAGKFVLIDFWATWCGPCRRAIPELNEIHRRLGARVAVIGISDENEKTVRAMKAPVIAYAVAIDTRARTKGRLEVAGIPHVILVDPTGVVRWEGYPLLESDPLTVKAVSDIVDAYFAAAKASLVTAPTSPRANPVPAADRASTL